MTCILGLWHVHAQMRHTAKKTLMIITISIRTFDNMFEAIIVQLTQKTGVSGVTEVFRAYLFLKHFRNVHSKGAAVCHPANDSFVLFFG
mmetsp:Transcript_1503/g.2039  ORF Transcript_1503/g.2039 Transcript_1503/m.2039 type:complete len:89 (-) Transcript_1503:393-659(-)